MLQPIHISAVERLPERDPRSGEVNILALLARRRAAQASKLPVKTLQKAAVGTYTTHDPKAPYSAILEANTASFTNDHEKRQNIMTIILLFLFIMTIILLFLLAVVILAVVVALYLRHYARANDREREQFDFWHDRYHRDL